jgi:glycosyltransferase involved in cell wall biosynthesis
MCGYSQEQVFPFCYAVDSPVVTSRDCSNMPRVNLCFIGQLIKRKRVDLLLCSLSRINSRNWFLRIIGSGKERLRLEKLVNSLGLAGMVDFTGVLDNPSARTQLAQSDVVVLPSQWDGWGAVVNEALMSGVPVICNDFCGASDLIQPIFNGELFECGSVDSLAVVLDKWISRGPLDVLARQKIRSWSRCIEGEAVARYFIQVVDYLTGSALERPKASWLSEDAVSLYY